MPAAAPHSPQTTPTRDRILYACGELFRRQGYAGTGLKQVLGQAQAPFGSLYHFFPEGKEQLGAEVLDAGGAFFLALYEAIVDAEDDLVSGLRAFFDGAAQTLVATDYQDACPIATVAGEVASTHDRLRRAAQTAFESWLDALAEDLRAAGAPTEQARSTALAVLALIEGAFLLSRTLRSVEPMRAAADAAVALVTTIVDPSPTPRSTR